MNKQLPNNAAYKTLSAIQKQCFKSISGYEQLPAHWLDKLFMSEKIETLAQRLACSHVRV